MGSEAKTGVRTAGLWASAFIMEAFLVRMAWLSDLQHHIVEPITLLLATSTFYLVSCWMILKNQPDRSRRTLFNVLFVALLFRFTVFPLYPAFSEDLYRYRWEGKLQSASYNPYTTRPDDPRLTPLRDPMYPRVVGKEFSAVYGPLAEQEERLFYTLIAGIVSSPARQVFWFKLPAALADLAVVAALCMLLRLRGMPLERVLLYAWCPLPVFEFWATGHNDAILLMFLILTLVFAEKNRTWAAALCLSLATLVKFWPALVFPLFTGLKVRRVFASVAGMAVTTVVVGARYAADLTNNARFATGFLGGWRNNDSLHALVAWLTPDPYAAKYVTIGLIGIGTLVIACLPWKLEARVLLLTVVLLALSANVHPWYVTWIVPLLAIYPEPGLLLWTALIPLAYQVRIEWTILNEWNGLSNLRWLVYGAIGFVSYFSLVLARRRRGVTR